MSNIFSKPKPEPTIEDRLNGASASSGWALRQFEEIVDELGSANDSLDAVAQEAQAEIDRHAEILLAAQQQRAKNVAVAGNVRRLLGEEASGE